MIYIIYIYTHLSTCIMMAALKKNIWTSGTGLFVHLGGRGRGGDPGGKDSLLKVG